MNTLAVHGLGGVGKSRAALEYAWRHAGDYTALLFVSGSSDGELRANLANLVGVLGMQADGVPVERQLAEVLDWLDTHPGWLLIVDNVDTDDAAREIEGLLARLRAGRVLITSRIGNWSRRRRAARAARAGAGRRRGVLAGADSPPTQQG